MSEVSIEAMVGQLVAENPARARIFEEYGIDYCCGEKKSLEKACDDQDIDPLALLQELDLVASASERGESDWIQASLFDLIDHIVTTHHTYLKHELPRLSYLVNKVARLHGDMHPTLHEVARIYDRFRNGREAHMWKEETVLFPMCKKLERMETRPVFLARTIVEPIGVMEEEHERAGQELAEMRSLTGGYNPPVDACNTYRVMLDGLDRLEADTLVHVHKEDSILFPRATALEERLPHE